MLENQEERFSLLYDKYAPMLYRIAYLHTGDKQESEDILQEVFIKYLYGNNNFKNDTHEKSWLIRVVTNECRDYLKSSRHSNMPLNDEIIAGNGLDNDKKIDVRMKMLSLDRKYKTVVYLHYYEDYTIEQIAACLKLSQSAVKMRLKRARDILKCELE